MSHEVDRLDRDVQRLERIIATLIARVEMLEELGVPMRADDPDGLDFNIVEKRPSHGTAT